MTKRSNHYEAAFEAWLRNGHIPYVAVDEKRRSLLGTESLKSLDFIVSPPLGGSWLIDIKGRQFPSGRQKQYWRNWSTRDDLVSLWRWERLFGEHFAALLVFAYQVTGDRGPLPEDQLFEFGDHLYGFIGIRLSSYAQHCRTLSPKWETVSMRSAQFRQYAAPLDWFFATGVKPEPFDPATLRWFGDEVEPACDRSQAYALLLEHSPTSADEVS